MSRLRMIMPLVVAVLYGASPIDLIPDLIPILGLSDDLTVLAIAVLMALHAARELRKRSQRGPQPRIILPPQSPGRRKVG